MKVWTKLHQETSQSVAQRLENPPRDTRPEASVATATGPASHWAGRTLPGGFVLLCGVVLPLVTMLVELFTRLCADIFFDPLPTGWHILVASAVPMGNLFVWHAVWRRSPRWDVSRRMHRSLGFMNGLALGVALLYALLFLPLTPLGLLALWSGLGLLPLTPLLSFLAALVCRHFLRRLLVPGKALKVPGLWWGIGLACVLLGAGEVPSTLTRLGLQMAASETPAVSLRGVRWLRAIGSEAAMLRACYQRPGRATDLVGFLLSLGDPVTPTQAREIYYRVTGVPFNAVPPPALVHRGRWGLESDWTFDADQGGTAVGGQVRELWLTNSSLAGSIDPDAALAYLEWTLVFTNQARTQHEARVQLALPPGGMVSRLTLWINGVEQEAAFGARTQVRQAYERVVQQRRDPVLITTNGPDRILVQCFPVPPQGGEMQIRIGITAPLLLESQERGVLRLPYFLERNFSLSPETRHAVWVESKRRLEARSDRLRPEQPAERLYGIRGAIPNAEMTVPDTLIRAYRDSQSRQAWTPDPTDSERYTIRQTLVEKPQMPLTHLAVVVDGSRGMQPFLQEIAYALRHLPAGIELSVLFAADTVLELTSPAPSGSLAFLTALTEQLRTMQSVGGRDNVAALARGWDIAAAHQHGALLWLHGPQPVPLQAVAALRQRLERRPDGPRLYALQVRPGTHRLVEALEGLPALTEVPRLGTVAADLARLFAQWQGQWQQFTLVRERLAAEAFQEESHGQATSAHLARLWAYDTVMQLQQAHKQPAEALQLALRYHLVTPLTGAVVLETQQQYTQAGLEPVPPGTVPTIPEPEIWMLLVVAALIVGGMLYHRRRSLPARP